MQTDTWLANPARAAAAARAGGQDPVSPLASLLQTVGWQTAKGPQAAMMAQTQAQAGMAEARAWTQQAPVNAAVEAPPSEVAQPATGALAELNGGANGLEPNATAGGNATDPEALLKEAMGKFNTAEMKVKKAAAESLSMNLAAHRAAQEKEKAAVAKMKEAKGNKKAAMVEAKKVFQAAVANATAVVNLAAKTVKAAAAETKRTLKELQKIRKFMMDQHAATRDAVDKALEKVADEEDAATNKTEVEADVASKEAAEAVASVPAAPVPEVEAPPNSSAAAVAAVDKLIKEANTSNGTALAVSDIIANGPEAAQLRPVPAAQVNLVR